MVRKGEYLERAVVIPGASKALEGLFHRGHLSPSVVIAAPHPKRGGSMEGPVIAELAWALTRAGHATLRFNYPGIGASAGVFSEAEAAEALAPVVQHLRECTPQREIVGVGVGYGGRLLLQQARSLSFEQVLWVAPEVEDLEVSLNGYTGGIRMLVAQGEIPERSAALKQWAQAWPRARYVGVPGADPRYLQGLVALGQVACELVQTQAEFEL